MLTVSVFDTVSPGVRVAQSVGGGVMEKLTTMSERLCDIGIESESVRGYITRVRVLDSDKFLAWLDPNLNLEEYPATGYYELWELGISLSKHHVDVTPKFNPKIRFDVQKEIEIELLAEKAKSMLASYVSDFVKLKTQENTPPTEEN